MVAEFVVLYCGSQRGMVDQVSLVLFPICFVLFTVIYWISYVSESRIRANVWPQNFKYCKNNTFSFIISRTLWMTPWQKISKICAVNTIPAWNTETGKKVLHKVMFYVQCVLWKADNSLSLLEELKFTKDNVLLRKQSLFKKTIIFLNIMTK